MKVKVPVQDAWASWVSTLPPPPSSVGGVAGGGEGCWAGSCLGILSKWQVFTADFTGGIFWRVISAHLFGGFSWPIGFKEKQSKVKRSKLCIIRGPIDSIMNIVYSQ